MLEKESRSPRIIKNISQLDVREYSHAYNLHDLSKKELEEGRDNLAHSVNAYAKEHKEELLDKLEMTAGDLQDREKLQNFGQQIVNKAVKAVALGKRDDEGLIDVSQKLHARNRRVEQEKIDEERMNAVLEDSRTHLQQSHEAYEQAAIEDANAAGHDVDFGGEHFPAQSKETTEK